MIPSVARLSCASCGGWVSRGIDPASWEPRVAEFNLLHRHIPGSPLVLKMPGISNIERDAYEAVLMEAPSYVAHQFTPAGPGKWAVFVSKRPAASSIKGEGVERIYVTSPGELAARLT